MDPTRARPTRRLTSWLERRPRWQIALGALLLLAGAGIADYLAGPALLSSMIYFVPLALGAWYGGRPVGLPLAVASAVACTYSRAEAVEWSWTSSLPYANGAVQLIAYVALVLVIVWLRVALDRNRELALHDALTGLPNRRLFLQVADYQLSLSRRNPAPLALAYLDLDDFKRVNDTLGHPRGDDLLREVARGLRASVRRSDLVARLGGDEFCVLLPDTGASAAAGVGEKLAGAVAPLCRAAVPTGGVSLGVAVFATVPDEVEILLEAADRAMYRVKAAGRGGVSVDEVDVEGDVLETVTEPGSDGGPRPIRSPVVEV